LEEVCIEIKGRKFWLWRAVDDSGAVLDLLLQDRRDTQATKTFLGKLLVNDDIPDVIHTDKLWAMGQLFENFLCSTLWSTSKSSQLLAALT